MKCQEVVESMHRYIDDDLNDLEKEQLFAHLKTCKSCSEKFEILKALSRDLQALPDVAPPFSLVDRIMPQLDAMDKAKKEQGSTLQEMKKESEVIALSDRQKNKSSQRWMKSRVGRIFMGTAAAAIVLGIAVFNYEPQNLDQAEVDLQLMSEVDQDSDPTSGSGGAFKQAEQPEESTQLKEFADDQSKTPDAPDTESDETASSEQVLVDPKQAESEVAADTEATAPKDGSSESGTASQGTAEQPSSSQASSGEGVKNDQVAPSSSQDKSVPASGTNTPPSSKPDESGQQSMTQGKENNSESQTGSTETAPESGMFSIQAQPAPSENGDAAAGNSSGSSESQLQSQGLKSMNVPTIATTISPKWLSPDGQYLVDLKDNKLSVYQLGGASKEEKKLLQEIEIKGTWITGSWTEDSLTYNYEMESEGKTTQHSYAVPLKSESTNTTAPSSSQNSTTPSSNIETTPSESKK
ncbi:zf-HC2 domain-containing protein [Neobacillus mesonae]|nr:zf-HC2 domain-containing protein [Neobacillus mesonae]